MTNQFKTQYFNVLNVTTGNRIDKLSFNNLLTTVGGTKQQIETHLSESPNQLYLGQWKIEVTTPPSVTRPIRPIR